MFTLFQRNDVNSIHINEIDDILEEINLIDIREPYECAHSSINGSRNIPMGQLLAHPEKYLDKNHKYHIMCQSGGRSSSTVSALVRAGFNVINVKGGMGGYSGINRK
ncbi:MAG: Rhodanese domain protein [Herbinix sp.]|jgi:rhodanese-related sulfurtransferase|nr:Rhodanese domain protein [Herbinix sp.]